MQSTSRQKSILLVEDDDFQRQVLKTQFSSLNVDILEACNGIEALEHVDRYGHCISLILCDLDMPKMDGMEFARHLGTREVAPNLALLSSSDTSMLSSVDTMCRAYGITTIGTFQKPLSRDQISKILKELSLTETNSDAPRYAQQKAFTETEIVAALESHQIQPHFQAKLDLSSNTIVGAEALARWLHPTLGLQAPFSFIPVLEQGQYIDALTFSLLRQAVAKQQEWLEQGHKMSIAVNLSPNSLHDLSFADRLTEIVTDAGIATDNVVFEVTETAAMQDLAPALENLARLRLRGFGLSIDDFGTGFASMEQLGRIAFTELKIDRSFVSTMLEKNESRAIVEFSINMAQKLGMRSVAEGVEHGEELELLRELGCDHVQGYFVAKPVDVNAFMTQLARGNRCTAA